MKHVASFEETRSKLKIWLKYLSFKNSKSPQFHFLITYMNMN